MSETEMTAQIGENAVLAGHIDRLSEMLRVQGWAWRPHEPECRVEIEFLINEQPAGRVIAGNYRQDVRDAGYGDGHYGFAWPLALAQLERAETIVITARDAQTGASLPHRLSFASAELSQRLAAFAAASEGEAKQLAALRAAARLAPENPWHAQALAEALSAAGRRAEAAQALRDLLQDHPQFWHAQVALGHLARAEGERAQANAWFEQAAAIAPAEPAPRLALIELWREEGRLEDARGLATQLLAAHPDHLPLLLNLAYIEAEAQRPDAAAQWFSAALALSPDDPALLAALAQQESRLGRQEDSQAHLLRALELDPGHVAAVSQLAAQALAAGEAEQAMALYRAAAARHPDETAFRFGLLDALAWQGRTEEALSGLEAIELEQGLSPELQSWRITLLRRTGQMEAALRVARAATLADPAAFWLAVERFHTELRAGSDAMLQKSLFGIPAVTPGEQAIRRRCVGALAESLWQMDSALAHYQAAAGINAEDIALQEALARVKLMRFDLAGARAHVRRQFALMAPERRLRHESLNISQSLLGQMIEEYALDAELAEALAGVQAMPAPARLEPLAALVCANPDHTAPAASLLLALRQAELLAFLPAPGGAPPIPRVINAFWHDAVLPADVETMLQSWRDGNPAYRWRRFDFAQARDYLAAAFPGPVLQAFLRVREIPQKVDIFRLALLVAEGGIFVAADDRCLQPVDTVLPPGASLVLAQEHFACIATHFVAAAPGHPVLQAALRAVVAAINRGDNEFPWLLSGPGLLTRALAQHLAARGVAAGLPPGLLVLDKRELGRVAAAECFAAYKAERLRPRQGLAAARTAQAPGAS